MSEHGITIGQSILPAYQIFDIRLLLTPNIFEPKYQEAPNQTLEVYTDASKIRDSC